MPRFDLAEFLGLVQKYEATVLPLVPPIVLGLVKHPMVASSTSPACAWSSRARRRSARTWRASSARKLGCPVVQGYGMTEASPVTHLSPTRHAPLRPGSAGGSCPTPR